VDQIAPNGVTALTFTIDNTGNADPVANLAFTDTLPTTPGAMKVASTPNASTDCTGATWSPTAGGATLTFSGGTVGANSSCTAQVDVTAATPGTYNNTSSALSSDQGTGPTASDSLLVNPLFVEKLHAAGTVPHGGTATFTVNIRNDGDETLVDLVVDDPSAPGCNRTFTSLAVDATETYTCTVAGVLASFTNTLTVTATGEISGLTASATASAVVTVAAEVVTTTPVQPALALTGSSTGPLTVAGLGALALGSLLAIGASNRRKLFRR